MLIGLILVLYCLYEFILLKLNFYTCIGSTTMLVFLLGFLKRWWKMTIITKYKTTQLQITANFSLDEFICPCSYCEYVTLNLELVAVLQHLRDYFGRSVFINSGYRCGVHNYNVGGKVYSQHRLGFAADIVVQGILPSVVQEYLITNQLILKATVGRYDTFTHVDVRDMSIVFDKRSKSWWQLKRRDYGKL